MAPLLREADRREMVMLGYDPVPGLVDMVDRATVAWTGLVDGLPFVIGGAHVPLLLGRVAHPWMWTAAPAQKLAKYVMRFSRGFLDDLSDQYPRLETYVDPSYAGARRLLEWLGFSEEGERIISGHRLLLVGRSA
jgi:hypothetical protein